MDDLLTEKGQKEAKDFFEFLCWSVENDYYESVSAPATTWTKMPVSVPECTKEKSGDVVILTDCEEGNAQLFNMIARFRAVLPRKSRVNNIREYP